MKIKNILNHLKKSFIDDNKLKKPKVIQFPVIDTCNSRCQMCRIWENKKSTDITIEQLTKGLSNDLFSEVEAIGFNGGEPTLRNDLIDLVVIVLDKLPSLKQVSIITNAYKYLQVIEQIDAMGNLVKSKGLFFDVMISLDGYGEVHNRVRGRSGNFENAKKVLSFLSTFTKVDNVRIGCTVIRENVFHLADLFEFCIENNLYIKYRQGVPHQRLYTENLLDPYALTFEEKYEFVEFLEGLIKYYEPSTLQKYFYRSLIDQIIHNKARKAGCDWQHQGATITAKGELAYCAVKSKALMDDISIGDPSKAYFDNQDHLRFIIKNHCDDCHHDYVGYPSAKEYRKILFSRIEERFNIKERAKSLPGFKKLNMLRNNINYNNKISMYRKSMADITNICLDKKTVLICGWYGTETLGDKGIIGGIMYSFRQKLGNDIQFIVVALHTYISQMTRRQMPEFYNTRIVTIEQGINLAKHVDFVVFGGGPLMAIDELAPMQVIFENAKQSNVTTIVAGCGVGPLGHSWHNNSIKNILELADVRIYRDIRSKEYAASLNIDIKQDKVAEDPAFTWLASINENIIDNIDLKSKDKHPVLLLGLRDFPYQDYAKHIPEAKALEIKNNYEYVVISALEALLISYPNLVIRPLPMCTNHFGSDDRWFYRALFRGKERLKSSIDYSLLGHEMAPIEYCNAFNKADALLAMRFHSLVFGLGIGLNSVALDYTLGKGKVKSLAERYNVPILDMMTLETDQLVKQLTHALNSSNTKPFSFRELSFNDIIQQQLSELL